MAYDYEQLVELLRNAHSDTIEILSSNLVDWLTGQTAVTFELSSGNFTVDSLPQIQAGTTTVVAGENLSANTPVKLVDDSGTTKAYALDEEGVTSSTMASGTADSMYYTSTYDRVLIVYEGSANDVQARIGTIASDNTISFSSENAVMTGGTAVADVTVVKMSDTEFVVAWEDNDNIYMRGGKFTDASTLSFGTQLDCSLTNIQRGWKLSTDETDTLNLLTLADDGATTYSLVSRLYTFTTGTSALAFVASSNKTVYTASSYGNEGIPADNAFNTCYNSDDDIFHILFSIYDTSNDSFLKHNSVNSTTGVLGSTDTIFDNEQLGAGATPDKYWYAKNMFYESDSETILVYLYEQDYINTTETVSCMRLIINSGRVEMADINFLHNLNSITYYTVYYDSTKKESFAVMKNQGTTSARLARYNADFGNDFLISFLNYDNSYLPTPRGIIKSSNKLLFGNTNSDVYVYTFDGRDDYVGVVTETISLGQNINLCPQGFKTSTFSSLTTGAKYYLQKDLSITTTKTSYSLGTALSATTMQLATK